MTRAAGPRSARHRQHLRAHRRTHRAAATVATSNREPIGWLALMADPLLAQSAIDRPQSAAHELVLDGESYRQRQKPTITDDLSTHPPLGDHHDADADTPEVVPSHWRWGGPIRLAGDSESRTSRDERQRCQDRHNAAAERPPIRPTCGCTASY